MDILYNIIILCSTTILLYRVVIDLKNLHRSKLMLRGDKDGWIK